jgi:hypothetical protein
VAVPEDKSFAVIVLVQAAVQADLEALDHITQTFTAVQ